MPFLAAQESGGAVMRKNTLLMASAGLDLTLNKNGNWLYEAMARYQYPVFATADGSNRFSINPIMAFDGLLGVAYRIAQPLRLGVYWYGQFHQYNFNYFESVEGVENTGSQSLFYSNAELRMGWEF
jgi:hypothetical protein